MDRLEQIKNEVCQEWGHTDWSDFGESFKHRLGSAHAERDEVVTEIARRYATEVARHNLERAANEAKVVHYQHDHGSAVDKQSIKNISIVLL